MAEGSQVGQVSQRVRGKANETGRSQRLVLSEPTLYESFLNRVLELVAMGMVEDRRRRRCRRLGHKWTESTSNRSPERDQREKQAKRECGR